MKRTTTIETSKETSPSHEIPLPEAPRTESPVPSLTSLHATPGRGPYGDPRYRGNCSGLLIKDLLLFFRPRSVLDPMQGGGTCGDVCRELAVPFTGFDLKAGFNAMNPDCFAGLPRFDFVWLHPPYWNMVRYSDDIRCLSNATSPPAWAGRMRHVIRNCKSVLSHGGHIAILIGDGKHRGRYMGLPFRVLHVAALEGLWLAAPEIIRFGHGATSSRKSYAGSLIPRLHDVCFVLKPDARGGRQG